MKPSRPSLLALAAAALAACSDQAPVTADAALDVSVADTASADATERDAAADTSQTDVVATDTPAEAARDAMDSANSDGATVDASGERARLEGLVDEVSRAICDALYRCCDAQSRADFFAPMRVSDRLASIRSRIPADGVLERSLCAPLVADAYRIVPLGGWVSSALMGRVTFRASEADACLLRLSRAACGAEIGAALRDGTCFGFTPPEGGDVQRRVFSRTGGEGAPCNAIADGVGGAIYGTCDPTRAYCCGGTPERCTIVGAGNGTCRAVSSVGAMCSVAPALRVCATGVECDSVTGRCVAPSTTQLSLGDACASGVRLLGECVDGYCDLGGSDRCEALRADGATCTFAYECRSRACQMGRCAPDTFCARPGA